MITIVPDDLAQDWNKLLAGVQRGQTYLIRYKGMNLAQLGPCPAPQLPTPAEPPPFKDLLVIDILSSLSDIFGTSLLAQLLCTTTSLLAQVSHSGLLNPYGRARLRYLQELSTLLSQRFTPKQIRHWVNTPQDAFKGRTPCSYLGGAWSPNSARAQHVWTLAQQVCDA